MARILATMATTPVLALSVTSGALVAQLRREHEEASGTIGSVERPSLGACECIPWTQAYSEPNMTCGSGLELYIMTSHGMTKAEAQKLHQHDFCFNFYKKLSRRFCVNVGWTLSEDWFGKSWCYVSKECNKPDPRGFPVAPVEGTNLSYKICQEGEDDILGTRTLPEVVKIGKELDLEISVLLKYAYPTWTGKPWDEVEPFWKEGAFADTGLRPDTKEALIKVSDSGKPMLFDSAFDGGLPLTVTVGNTVHQVQIDDEFLRGRRIYGVDSLTWLVCLYNCPPEEIEAKSPEALALLSQRPLPGGWHSKLDQKSGKNYFWNDAGTVTWNRPQGDCTCLNWRDTYLKRGVECGQGLEFTRFLKYGMSLVHARWQNGWAFCKMFFRRINDNFCARASPELTAEWYGGTWCYVDSSCKDLGGGERVNGTNVSYKFCVKGEDNLLGYRSPQELVKVQADNYIEMGMIMKMAYPVWPRQRWDEVKNFWKETDLPYVKRHLPKQVRPSLLQQLVLSGAPMLFESQFGGLPFAVTQGMTAYHVNYKADFFAETNTTHKLWRAGNDCNVSELVCVMGCLPAGWHETLDKASGSYYYWHESNPSGTITWVSPAKKGRQAVTA